ncbi:hypothetical protein ED208_01455 [Stagnimonas aquatica]|uniref:Uncharacterized protein n=1 Tax=Stagnimonas aquatica TaxID=2689987 RepID=A0A3N0VKJ0_9GAMM|nr:hypothetical protein [Stagnimonas aquatica]ROH93220.1 hypothetical protein ED208_01455 [Stagnimonas aquatica]
MGLSEAIRRAAECGCELEPIPGRRRYLIRAIGYDADPYEIDEDVLLGLSSEEFLREWIPARV